MLISELKYGRPDWEKGMFEQIVTNLNLNLTLVYVGREQWAQEMKLSIDSGSRQLFYDFFPTGFRAPFDFISTPLQMPDDSVFAVTTAQLDLSRVQLPEYVPSQHTATAPNRWNANGGCSSDFPGTRTRLCVLFGDRLTVCILEQTTSCSN